MAKVENSLLPNPNFLDSNLTTFQENNQNQLKQKVQPFLQWVGGKRRIADQLIEYIPKGLNNYYEPFLGGGALFYSLKQKGLFKQYFLSDINLDLVNTYNAVKKNPTAVSSLLKEHNNNHSKEYYYQVRCSNNSNDPFRISARLLYLNRYSFKGIYRLNKNGGLDLSFATKTYKTSKIDQTLKTCSSFLNNTIIYSCDFSFIEPQKNDFVYFDPPYHQAGERFYTRLPFDERDQVRLKNFANELDSNGVKFMISNSDTKFIRDLYQDFKINTIEVSYSMPKKREKKEELVIMNY